MSDPELEAVEAALDTLALAETESAFQKVVSRLLPAILSALSSPSPRARAKCVETLDHIRVRVIALPNISLPFKQVLQVAGDPSSASLTRSIAIEYGFVALCFERLTRPQKAAQLPSLIEATKCVERTQDRDALHVITLKALTAAAIEIPRSSGEDLWNTVSTCAEDQLNGFFQYGLLALRRKTKTSAPEPSLVALIRLASEYAGVRQPEKAAKVFPHFLVAAGTSDRTALMTAGEEALKRIDTCDVLAAADPTISDNLFELFNDRMAEVPLRIVILSKGLLKVTLCASCFPEVLDVFERSLITPGLPPRLQALGMQFVSFVIKNSEDGPVESNANAIIEMMMKLVTNETDGGPSFSHKIRGFSYTAIADLVMRTPSLMGRKPITPDLFFSAALNESLPEDVRIGASQALVALKRVLFFKKDDESSSAKDVRATLLDIVEREDDVSAPARAAAVQWATECFEFVDTYARMINIIAAGDSNQKVRQHAIIGLSPQRDGKKEVKRSLNENENFLMPDFSSFVESFVRYKSKAERPKSVSAFLWFSMFILNHCMLPKGRLGLLSVSTLEEYFAKNPAHKSSMLLLLNEAHAVLLRRTSKTESDMDIAALSAITFGSLTKSFRSDIAERYKTRIDHLVDLAAKKSAVGETTVVQALARLVGITAEFLPKEKLERLVTNLGTNLAPESSGVPSGRHGEDGRVARILCLGQIISRSRHRNDAFWNDSDGSVFSTSCSNIMRRMTLAVDSSTVVRASACTALSSIGAEGALPLALDARERVIGTLGGILKLHSSEAKLVEAATDALGRICAGEPRCSFRQTAFDSLLHVCRERKEEEVRFTASENLVRCASGFDAPPPTALVEKDARTGTMSVDVQSEELQSLLQVKIEPYLVKEEIFGDMNDKDPTSLSKLMRSTVKLAHDERPNARAGGCVALFTFLRMLGTKRGRDVSGTDNFKFSTDEDKARFKKLQETVQNFLPEAQQAFSVLLGDQSDFVQQLASCGVALVYDMCPLDLQRDLVSNLVRSLTSGKARAATVPGDQGALLEIGGIDSKEKHLGNRSATYKELCSLAQDMGQPELVYKFMDLAGHAALWNSRKGAALAGRALLDNDIAAEQLRPHVNNLLPRLYVYCYDPTESVKTAMGTVLGAVVKASGLGSVSEAVTAHFEIVAQHCLKAMSSRQWRSREAACRALRDTLVSRPWEQVKDSLGDFWYYTLRALDDIKESVRKAAEGTGRALSELSIHLCNPEQVSVEVGKQAISIVIPSVLPGFTHRVEGVRALTTKTLSEIIRFGGDALKPKVSELASHLLEAATELEPQVLNYAQFHVDQPDELQDARANAAATSASPIVDSLERLAVLVDESIIDSLVPVLTRLARFGVGIPTRAATARFFATLLRSRAVVVEPYASKLLFSASGAASMERNHTLRTAWCTAAGIAAKLSTTADVAKFVRRVEELSGSEDPNERSLASFLALGLWRTSPETARKHSTAVLPVAYMGRYETDDDAKAAGTNWKEVWSEGSPSTEAGLRLYAREITEICSNRLLSSSQYRVKRSAAAALGALAEASKDSVDVKYLRQSASSLLASLPGHIWDGKVVALEALGTIASSCSDLKVWSELGGPPAVVTRLLNEAHRGKKEYRLAAIEATEKLLNRCHTEFDLFQEVQQSLQEHITGLSTTEEEGSANISRVVWETGSDADAVDARNRARKAQKLLCTAAVSCLEAAYPGSEKGDRQQLYIGNLLVVAESFIKSDWDLKLAVLKMMKRACSRTCQRVLSAKPDSASRSNISRIASLGHLGILDAKYAALRKAGLSILLALGNQMEEKEKVSADFTGEQKKAILDARFRDSDSSVESDAKKVCTMYDIR